MNTGVVRAADKAALWTLWLFLFMVVYFSLPAALFENLFLGKERLFIVVNVIAFGLPLLAALSCVLLLVSARVRRLPLGKVRVKWVVTALILVRYILVGGFLSQYL